MTIRLNDWKDWARWLVGVTVTGLCAGVGFAGGLVITVDRRFIALENDMRDRKAEIHQLRVDVEKKASRDVLDLQLGFMQSETKRLEVTYEKLVERLRDKIGIFVP
jgi:hypothetical protein